jgi:hypothetical protein
MQSAQLKSTLTFKYLIEFWRKQIKENRPSYIQEHAKSIITMIDNNSVLSADTVDIKLLPKYTTELEAMMSIIFPYANYENIIFGAMTLFEKEPFYLSPLFNKQCNLKSISKHADESIKQNFLYAYSHIFQELYNIDLHYDSPMIEIVRDPQTNLTQYLRILVDAQFVRITPTKTIKPISEEAKEALINNFTNLDWLIQHYPPQDYHFEGFLAFNILNITPVQVTSQIKQLLIQSDSIIDNARFKELENHLKSLLNIPSLSFIMAASRDDDLLVISASNKMNHGCVYHDTKHYKVSQLQGCIYKEAVTTKTAVIRNNNACQDPETSLTQYNKNNIAIPLIHSDEFVGILGFSSESDDEFSSVTLQKLEELIPLFALIVKRYIDDFNIKVQLLIQKEFTAIHPSVAWRFEKAAINYVDGVISGEQKDIEEIVFNDVYPLYAVSDIRGSTEHRNSAISNDFIDNLNMAKEVITLSLSYNQWPILEEYLYRIEQYKKEIEEGLKSGEEFRVVQFLKREIEVAFNDLRYFDECVSEKIDAYLSELESESGLLYHKRREFDESVTMLNVEISKVIDQAQEEAQAMYPHYFDKQITDGADQNLYIAKSMSELEHFDMLYVKNLRLWQFETLCHVAINAHNLKTKLPVDLDTTHLIVVQNVPLTISFNQDEKRFRVDGAYNIRYEIMKKRIDKAIILGSGERLTQPHQIAIVYSQMAEVNEYKQYIEYLQDKGLLEEEIEMFELESLQGISGLKAIRVNVKITS